MSGMTIGKLARAAGVGVETIRFYERKRLLSRPRRPERGFRTYPDDATQRIRFIRQAQDLGFTLREIAELLSLRADPNADCAKVFQKATIKLEDVLGKIVRLRRIKRALEAVVAACPRRGAVRTCSILDTIEHREPASARRSRRDAALSRKRQRIAMKTMTLKIAGMHCDGCAETIKALLDAQPAVRQSAVSYKDGQARILFDPSASDEDQLAAAVEKAGFRVQR